MQESSDEDCGDSTRPQSALSKHQLSTGSSTLDTAACLAPTSFSGFLLKSRKSPMKGWHKVTHFSEVVDY